MKIYEAVPAFSCWKYSGFLIKQGAGKIQAEPEEQSRASQHDQIPHPFQYPHRRHFLRIEMQELQFRGRLNELAQKQAQEIGCLLYTSDAADDGYSVDLGGRRIIKKIFFKQKTAYEISEGLVGSEMCIRDSLYGDKADTKRWVHHLRKPAHFHLFAPEA